MPLLIYPVDGVVRYFMWLTLVKSVEDTFGPSKLILSISYSNKLSCIIFYHLFVSLIMILYVWKMC